jgi:ketosteroid isomerase-like protein
MIASWIVKRMLRRNMNMMSEDDFSVDALLKNYADDAVYDVGSELGVGETMRGKKAIADWLHRLKKEFPRRKVNVKSICFSAWPLSPSNVAMVEWTWQETDKEGREFTYDAVSVMKMKKFKLVQGGDYVSFKGLPKISDLIKTTVKA